jgi:hypothetical protein
MLHKRTNEPSYNLEDLAKGAVLEGRKPLNLRTIRSWMKAGVVPGPEGKGQGKHYGERHRLRLLFLQRIQIAIGTARLPLRFINANLPMIGEEVIRRVALGEEELKILGADLLYRDLSAEEEDLSPGESESKVNYDDHDGAGPGPWTTIPITEDISLRMRGYDPDQVTRLNKMAIHLREWSEDEL